MNPEELLAKYANDAVAEILLILLNETYGDSWKKEQTYQRIQAIIEQFGLVLEEIVPPLILKDYFEGVDKATLAMIAGGAAVAPALALTPEGLISKPFQKLVHMEAVESLIDAGMDDLRAARRTAIMSFKSNIDETLADVQSDIAKGFIKGDARKTTQKRVIESFQKGGLTSFVTSDGKRLPLNFYAMTVVRTKRVTASIEGSNRRYIDAGQDLVEIEGNGDQCAICARYRGMVISLTGKTEGYPVLGGDIKLPPYHPNCRCGHVVFMPKFLSAEEVEAAKKRNAKFDPEKDNRTPAQKAAYDSEQKKRRIANEENKLFDRMKNLQVDGLPANIGAFRSMKRNRPEKYAELMNQYKRITTPAQMQ